MGLCGLRSDSDPRPSIPVSRREEKLQILHTATIDERCPSLGLLDKMPEEMRFIWKIKTLNTTF
jgi:hypothetical protein